MKSNKQKESKLTLARIKELLDYNPINGVFTWIAKSSNYSNVKVGEVAGCVNKGHGYVCIWIDGQYYLAHRLAWFYNFGVFPDKVINHKNQDKTDNRVENLEDTTQKTNNQNRSKQSRQDPSLPMGVVAVKSKSKLDKNTIVSYYAHWTDMDGVLQFSPFFNIIKCGGDDIAKELATGYRISKIAELNTQGAGYTERHGKQCTPP